MRKADTRSSQIPILVAAALTSALLWWASFHPTSRVWGLSVWAYLEVWQRATIFGLLLAATVIILGRRTPASGHAQGSVHTPVWLVLAVAVSAGTLFFLFRTQVHFLGDGYFLLKSLASEHPLMRARNLGELLVHKWIRDLLPLQGEPAALTSFRIVSIGAGVLHAALVTWLGPVLTGHRQTGLWFALGMMTGGYALLHFGYVENYSLFGLAVAAFVYIGMLIAAGRIHRAWILPVLAAAIFFHALGLALTLPTLYLLWARTEVAARLGRMGLPGRVLVMACLVTLLGVASYSVIQRWFFLAFAMVPMEGNARVLEGYSMFSRAHFADVFNQVVLLLPAVLLLAMALGRKDWKRWTGDPRIRFLAVASMTTFATIFVFEAKLGMPRDWDLFSFAGYPWMALLLLAVILSCPVAQARRTILSAVAVALLCLAPRVLTARTPELGIRQFRDYAEIDRRKNRSGWYVLRQYYAERGDSTSVRAISNERARRFPEEDIMHAADQALKDQQIEKAIDLGRQAIRINPTMAHAWFHLGACYIARDRMDSAILVLSVSKALNPDVPLLAAMLGLAYYATGQVDKAEAELLEAYRLDARPVEPVLALARLNQSRGDMDRYVEWLERAVYMEACDAASAMELADVYLGRGDLAAAGRALEEAMRKGADSSEVRKRVEAHPEVKYHLRR